MLLVRRFKECWCNQVRDFIRTGSRVMALRMLRSGRIHKNILEVELAKGGD